MWSDLLVVGETVVAIVAAWWPYVLIVLAVLAVIGFVRAGEVVRGAPVTPHVRTDPACRRYVAPRRGSRLDRRSRGYSCPVCAHDRLVRR